VLLPSKGDVTIGGGTEEPGVHLKKIKRSSLKRKGQAIKRAQEITHIDKVKRLQGEKSLSPNKPELRYSDCSSTYPFIFNSLFGTKDDLPPYVTSENKEFLYLRRQVSSESSLASLDTHKQYSSSFNKESVLKTKEKSPKFYITSDVENISQKKPKETFSDPRNSNSKEEEIKMRGSSLRNGGRPANSMEQDSFDSFDDMEDMLVVSTTNSLNLNNPNISPGSSSTSPNVVMSGLEPNTEDELPKSIIVTNVDTSVFDNSQLKAHFERMFRDFEPGAAFHYLPSFRRIRVDFESHLSASNAKQHMDSTILGDNTIHCYFIQVLSPCTDEEAFLHVPPLEKQFLISPPCSPPVGWEQPREDKPVVDYDLLAAMAQLSPGKNHELHPSKEVTLLGKSISTPSIVVHVCEEESGVAGLIAKTKIGVRPKNTPCPGFRQNSLE